MYSDNIYLFNHYVDDAGAIKWHVTQLTNCDVNTDRSVLVRSLGEASADRASIHIKTERKGGKTYAGSREVVDNYRGFETVSFRSGEEFDFVVCGNVNIDMRDVRDDDYTEGFYSYMNSHYPRVYAITSCSEYSVIPHLEVIAR